MRINAHITEDQLKSVTRYATHMTQLERDEWDNLCKNACTSATRDKYVARMKAKYEKEAIIDETLDFIYDTGVAIDRATSDKTRQTFHDEARNQMRIFYKAYLHQDGRK